MKLPPRRGLLTAPPQTNADKKPAQLLTQPRSATFERSGAIATGLAAGRGEGRARGRCGRGGGAFNRRTPGKADPATLVQTDALARLRAEQEKIIREIEANERLQPQSTKPQRMK